MARMIIEFTNEAPFGLDDIKELVGIRCDGDFEHAVPGTPRWNAQSAKIQMRVIEEEE